MDAEPGSVHQPVMPAGELLTAPEAPDEFFEWALDQGWGDGLPLIPPTPERVARTLATSVWDPDHVVARIPPMGGEATVRVLAANAVMAGCPPEHLDVLIACVEAVCREEFNLHAVQVTTNPVTTAVLLSGPVVGRLGFNSGANCMGQGTRANATLGRALRLVLSNVGGARPGALDCATHGQPGKFSFCFAENAADTPWQPLGAALGAAETDSLVTVIPASGVVPFVEPTGEAEELLDAFAASMVFPCNHDMIFEGEPWIVLAPEHAAVLARAGHDRRSVQAELWRRAQLPASAFGRVAREYWMGSTWAALAPLHDDTPIPVTGAAEQLHVVVAGGPSIYSVHLPTFGGARSVSSVITGPDGSAVRY